MTPRDFVDRLQTCPLIASVQASEGSPVDDPGTLLKLAQASLAEGVQVLRLQGVDNIAAIRQSTSVPIIGLIKRSYGNSDIYITPTIREVNEVIDAGSEIVAMDGTPRPRPSGESLAALIAHAHERGALVLADIDSVESALFAVSAGADFVSTTLAGYTPEYTSTNGPDLNLLRKVARSVSVPVFAEGRFAEPWQVQAALRISALGVIIGGALNDPIKTTRRFLPPTRVTGKVGAVDIGGTWMRFATFSPDWELLEIERMPLLEDRQDRIDWIRSQVKASGVSAVGVSTGGIVDPKTGELWEAKPIIPDHVGSVFSEATLGVPTVALNDGLAAAWGHACLPQFAGKRVATLALGTGVGCGFVADGKILRGPRGEYPRVNDLPAPGGATYEQLMGGAALSPNPDRDQIIQALTAFFQAGILLQEMYFPDEIVCCGAVALSDWMVPYLTSPGLSPSPFGLDAGLHGAAALILFPGGL